MSESQRIRVGNQTAFSAPLLAPFEYAVACGFDAFEFFPDKKESGEGWEESDVSGELRLRIRDVALSHDIRLSVHSPWPSNPLKPGASDALFRTLDFAHDIGAVLFNIHFSSDQDAGAYIEAITPLARQLADSGIALSIENTPDNTPEDFNNLFRLLNEKGPGNLRHIGMCLDLGHANLCRTTRNDYLGFVDRLDPHVPVTHIHMHENYGDLDLHLPLFTGPAGQDTSGITGFLERMKGRRFSGSIILEQWPQPHSLLDQARDRLIGIIHGIEKTGSLPSDDFVARIADANNRFLSWRKRLEWVRTLFTEDGAPLSAEQLAYIAIYLRFIGTGEVRCSEDGGHYRPSVHATTARQIYRRLVRMTSPENSFIIRKIYPWLPSFDREFIRAEPLTRIRDIAHRNDIPRELKQEIKETLQNKLHRSAGPEDLVTSENLLGRITAPDAGYSPAFVEEFRRFHSELRDFFHAGSLREDLERVIRKEAIRDTGLIRDFLKALSEPESPEYSERRLELLTALREKFLRRFADYTSAEAQQLQLADIRLGDFSFVVLNQLINSINSEQIQWGRALRCLSLTIRNLRLSGFDAGECTAIESELNTWSRGFRPDDRTHLLRLKATLERVRRLSDAYCGRILALFPERAERLGHALGVAEHAIKAFSEGDLRGHPVFQISRLISLLLRNIRVLAALPQWDAVVTGRASGRLVSAHTLHDLYSPFKEPVIVLVEKIRGDEDLPLGVAGLIVAHETPLLSHLAVRARQRDLVFAACEDPDPLGEIRTYIGKYLFLNVSDGTVTCQITSDLLAADIDSIHGASPRNEVVVPDALLLSNQELLTLNQITISTGGAKANAARLLEELSGRDRAGFRTPEGVVVPLGIMERALSTSGMKDEYLRLIAQLSSLKADDFMVALARLRDMIAALRVPQDIVSGVINSFRRGDRLMVRSSSNCEDIEGFTGAGLYDSVANVAPSKVAHAVSAVWSSLWNWRAALSREKAGIPHEKAHMAVLVQQMVVPDFSFIVHTINPVSRDHDEVYMELAVGLGGTLASAETPGGPYRMVFNKKTEKIQTLAFASFGSALYPGPHGEVMHKTVDYSGTGLSSDEEFRNTIGCNIGSIGRFVEKEMGRPQDIEGVITENTIYLVQSRPLQADI